MKITCPKCGKERECERKPKTGVCFRCWIAARGQEVYVRPDGAIDLRPKTPRAQAAQKASTPMSKTPEQKVVAAVNKAIKTGKVKLPKSKKAKTYAAKGKAFDDAMPKAKASKRPLILGKYSPVAVIGFYGQRRSATLDQIVGALDAIAKEMGLKKLASPATIQRKRFAVPNYSLPPFEKADQAKLDKYLPPPAPKEPTKAEERAAEKAIKKVALKAALKDLPRIGGDEVVEKAPKGKAKASKPAKAPETPNAAPAAVPAAK
jgi:hypothetical protein